jgi:NAD(P)-dependent dehydrogenase (short-subunit alcohol dehydrogenase family)
VTTAEETWLVVGSSTGIGRGVVEAIAASHGALIATARRPETVADIQAAHPDRVLAVALDVLDPASIDAAVQAGLDRFGRIDRLVHCPGAGLVGSIEEASRAEVERVFATNMYGVMNVLDRVLPLMREQRDGRLGIITSQGAFQGQRGCGIYCASKAATNALCEALAAEVTPLGVYVTIIEPGLVDTSFHGAIAQSESRLPDYEATCGALREAVTHDPPETAHSVASAAAAILTVMRSPHPPLNLPLGADAVNLIRHKLGFVADELDRWEEVSLSVKSATLDQVPEEERGTLHWSGPLVSAETAAAAR